MPDDISAGPLRLASNSADLEAALLLSKAGVSDNGRGAWAVWLSPEATVVELSALMGGLAQSGRRCTAEHMGAGVFVLIPIDENTTRPDSALLVSCMSECVPSRLVNLRAFP